MNQHPMMTRLKKQSMPEQEQFDIPINDPPPDNMDIDEEEDIDEHGNIKGLIDYSYDKKIRKKRNKKKKNTKISLSDFIKIMMEQHYRQTNPLQNLLILKSSNNIKDSTDDDNDDNEEVDKDLNEDSDEVSEEISDENNDESNDGEEDESDSDVSDYDELDEQYMEIEDNLEFDEDENINYFHKLEPVKKEKLLEEIKKVNEINDLHMPLKFKILNSDMDINTKAIAVRNIEKLSEMDVSSGEYSKMDTWINGLISVPFNKFVSLPVTNENSLDEKRDFILNTKKILDNSIYGHLDAKTHILQVIGKWIKNPLSQGNVLALQGPMGNGKTTLVKDGISKAIGRPFHFIALGGQSDSSLFEGHSYTYEGSHWGRILDIIMQSKCMNPVIYFDELDKVSDTHKGEEIIHMLTHLTDPSQNSLFQDNYYPGINIDLSKVLFIFSFNDESKINRILKDRMYVINTKGYNTKEKIKICSEYILPELYETYLFKREEIIITDEILEYIISKYTEKEEGVRNLKRCIENIISKINIYYLTGETENVDLNFKIKDFKLPYTIKRDDIDNFLKQNFTGAPPSHMYM
tara:strand:- start:93 stop:1823 length:1731 start_codon:yes stop_codon:yes gene_type:complete